MTREEAKGLNLPRFDSTEPCIRGHVGPRYTNNGSCCECSKICTRKRYSRAKERLGHPPAARPPYHRGPKKKADLQSPAPLELPVAQSDFMKPLTREQLMAGRA